MILGSYYLTVVRPGAKGEGSIFADVNEAIRAYETGVVDLQAQVKVPLLPRVQRRNRLHSMVDTTVGRILFNEAVPQDMGFVDRERSGETCSSSRSTKWSTPIAWVKIVDMCYHASTARTKTCEVLDRVKAPGLHVLHASARLTVSVIDIRVPDGEKGDHRRSGGGSRPDQHRHYRRGLITERGAATTTSSRSGRTPPTEVAEAHEAKSMEPFNPHLP